MSTESEVRESLAGAPGFGAVCPLRSETFETSGCPVCGGRARWVDSVRGPDYWTLPCGHKDEPIPIKIITMTVPA